MVYNVKYEKSKLIVANVKMHLNTDFNKFQLGVNFAFVQTKQPMVLLI